MAARGTGVWAFLRAHKRFWLLPMLLVFVLFALLVLGSVGSESEFTYTLD